MIPTESVYAAFISPLREFAQNFNDREYINTSLVGAQIDGYKNMPLDEALKDSYPIENRELVSDFKYDIEKIKKNIKLAVESLKSCEVKIYEGEKYVKSLNNELKRYRCVSPEVLKGLKKLSVNYYELSNVFAKQNLLFDYITTAEKIDLDYEMKMTKEFTLQTVSNIVEKTNIYYTNALKRIAIISNLLLKTCEELK